MKKLSLLSFAILTYLFTLGQTFQNPVRNSAADPFMTYYKGFYYLTYTTVGHMGIVKAASVADLKSAPETRIFSSGDGNIGQNVWAPELHRLKGPNGYRWYFYYSAGASPCCNNQRNHVLESAGEDPMGPYTYKARIFDPTNDIYAIDANILEKPDGSLYFLYTTNGTGSMRIAPMSNPWTISGAGVEITTPEDPWETISGNTNEGPEVIHRNGKYWVVHSGNNCGSPDYSLGMVYIDENADLLNPNNWIEHRTAIFRRNDAANVYGPGHHGFFKSPSCDEDWFIYHAVGNPAGACDGSRSARIQKITWNADGSPNLGVPLSLNTPIEYPAGDPKSNKSCGTQEPFKGTPLLIPGTIETEDFDKGGQGVSYFDTDGTNNGGEYRPNDGVDIQICQEGGFNTGWTFDNEWMEYTVNVATTGNYTVSFRVATPNNNCKFHLEFDGVDKTGAITVSNTGGYQAWKSVEKQVTLKAGTHVMRYYIDAASGGVNMNKFVFTSAGAPLLGTGTGLTGNYFNGMNFETPVFTRVDETINFNWLLTSPDATVNIDNFSARWTGAIEPLYSENYTFFINSDNGRKLWINDQLIIDKWLADWGTEYSGQITLTAGQQYTFKMEYFEEAGGANAKLEWESTSQPRQVISKTQLYPKSLITASENNFAESGIQIYPNPVAGDYFSIDLSTMKEVTTAILYDATGNLIYSQVLNGENPKIPVPEKQGIYLLNLRGNNFNYATKVVISK